MVKLTAATAFGLVALASAAANVKVMPFGASIVTHCWRANLWQKLQADNTKNFNFVGGQTGGECGGISPERKHEGHSGAQATQFASYGNLTGWLNAAKPDVIVMHLGTNDAIAKKTTEQTLDAFTTLVGQMRASKSDMRIIVSKLIPIKPDKFPGAAEAIVSLNQGMDAWAQKTKVTLVDNFADFDPVADTYDGQHPNDSGNVKIANKFFPAVRDAIKSKSQLLDLDLDLDGGLPDLTTPA